MPGAERELPPRVVAGVDAGSRTLKIMLFDPAAGVVIDRAETGQGIRQAERARALYDSLLTRHGLSPDDVRDVVATGAGRSVLPFATRTAPEVECQARGVWHLVPGTRTVFDVGGQSGTCIRLDARGAVAAFSANNQCAAGTGRFLEIIAGKLEMTTGEMGQLALESTAPATLTSTCVVFAESEIAALLAGGMHEADIVAGILRVAAIRVAALGGPHIGEPVVFTGGAARVPGMAAALAGALGISTGTPPEPGYTCALGAALIAADQTGETSSPITRTS
jgi:(R)-2-hydroxyacyl-CoA dehydratese activating ATPase